MGVANMDNFLASKLFEQIKENDFDGITIYKLIDNGKSAAVFKGERNDSHFAIKIFDNDNIVQKYGASIQQQRIDLELSLKDHNIPNLVKIIGGGHKPINGFTYYYLIMEYIEGTNLRNYIKYNELSIEFIVKVIRTLVTVTEDLIKHSSSLVHRDIKPENIMISEKNEVILMDLGVLKIVGSQSITDVDEKQFIGTLRYAPPEFLTRDELDIEECWRSINVYQIGAVLHDMIMRKELFWDVAPFTKLVIAIKEEPPKIINDKINPDLLQLARNMLQKDWKKRLEMCNIDRILLILEKCLKPHEEANNLYSNIFSDALPIKVTLNEILRKKRNKEEIIKRKKEIQEKIWEIIDDCFSELRYNEFIQNIENTEYFALNNCSYYVEGNIKKLMIYIIHSKFEFGFIRPVLIFFNISNDELYNCKIKMSGLIPDNDYRRLNINNPEEMFNDIFRSIKMRFPQDYEGNRTKIIDLKLTNIFNGIIEFEDNTLKNIIKKKTAFILTEAKERMKSDVQEELARRLKEVTTGKSISSYIYKEKEPIIIELGIIDN
jgi:serine/threonine protein kinase